MSKKVRTQIILYEEDHIKLKEMSKGEDISMASIVRKALKMYFKSISKKGS